MAEEELKAEIKRLRVALAATIGVVASYKEPEHYAGSVFAGAGDKARDEILAGIRLLIPSET